MKKIMAVLITILVITPLLVLAAPPDPTDPPPPIPPTVAAGFNMVGVFMLFALFVGVSYLFSKIDVDDSGEISE